jgi:hypothetical protein
MLFVLLTAGSLSYTLRIPTRGARCGADPCCHRSEEPPMSDPATNPVTADPTPAPATVDPTPAPAPTDTASPKDALVSLVDAFEQAHDGALADAQASTDAQVAAATAKAKAEGSAQDAKQKLSDLKAYVSSLDDNGNPPNA